MDKVESGHHLLFVETTSEEIEDLLASIPEFPEAIMSQSDQEFRRIWTVRESIATTASK